MDSTAVTQLTWTLVTIAAWGFAIGYGVWTVKNSFVPYFKSRSEEIEDEDAPTRSFPTGNLVTLLVMLLGAFLFTTYEPAFRDVNAVDNPLPERREAAAREVEQNVREGNIRVVPSGEESLEEKSRRKLEAAREQNEKAKANFDKLPDAPPDSTKK